MKAHVFYYRWPRLKEGLTHEAIDDISAHGIAQDLPLDSFIYYHGKWYLRHRTSNPHVKWASAVVHDRVSEGSVPKEIRTHLLLLT